MSIRLIVTRGYGNGTFDGAIGDVVLRGYTPVPSLLEYFERPKYPVMRGRILSTDRPNVPLHPRYRRRLR